MKDTLETRDSVLGEMLDAGQSEDELLNTPYAYERFVREDTITLTVILLATMKTTKFLNWHQNNVNQNLMIAFIQVLRS